MSSLNGCVSTRQDERDVACGREKRVEIMLLLARNNLLHLLIEKTFFSSPYIDLRGIVGVGIVSIE